MELSHIDEKGKANMVDVSDKEFTKRTAIATATVTMKEETLSLILDNKIPKGDVFACARIAGIMAAKKTPDFIPMCHPIPLEKVSVDIEPIDKTKVKITASTLVTYKTGVEMEALTAASVAALTIYDMCKSVDRAMEISDIKLLYKDGGKSGVFERRV